MGLLIPQLFNINLGKFDNQSTLFGTTQERLGLGLCGILIVGLFVYGCIMGFAKNKWERRLCALMTFVTLFLTTCIFPYDLFQRILGRFSGIVINLQFPWRFLAIAAVMLTWMLCMLFQFFRGEYNRINILACVLGGCIVLQSLDLLSGLMNEGKVYRLYNTSAISTWTIHGWEYMPVGVWTEFPKEAEVVEGERATVATEHLMGRVKLNVNNSDEGPVHVDVPLVYYKYYIAVDETGRSFFVQNNGKGYVQVEIPPGYEGKITVRFKEPWIWRMAEVLSVLAVFCEVLIMKKDICYARKKRV